MPHWRQGPYRSPAPDNEAAQRRYKTVDGLERIDEAARQQLSTPPWYLDEIASLQRELAKSDAENEALREEVAKLKSSYDVGLLDMCRTLQAENEALHKTVDNCHEAMRFAAADRARVANHFARDWIGDSEVAAIIRRWLGVTEGR